MKARLPLLIFSILSATTLFAELQPRDRIVVQTLVKLGRYDVSGNEKWKGAVLRYAESVRGTEEHLDIVTKFKVREECPALVESILAKPQGAVATNSAKLLFTLGEGKLLADALAQAKPDTAKQLLGLLGFVLHPGAAEILAGYLGASQDKDLQKVAATSLQSIGNPGQKAVAQKYLGNTPTTASGQAVDVAKLSKRTGKPANGKAVFQRICFACHIAEDIGIDYGPTLTEIGSKLPKIEIYTAIIDPNAGVSFDYEGWTFQLKDGTTAAGIIQSETASEITLRMPGGLRQTLEKSNIQGREKMKTSLMPPGLHLAMQEQDLVDLVEYLARLKKK
jgi:putative heme-binding domain-containing protein